MKADRKNLFAPTPTPPPSIGKWLSAADVRNALGVSQSTFDRMIADGKFPAPIRVAGRLRRWRESTVSDFLKNLESAAGSAG